MKIKFLESSVLIFLLTFVVTCHLISCHNGSVHITNIISDTIIVKNIKIKKNQAFPSIITAKDDIDQKINTDLANRHTDDEYPNMSVDKVLTNWANEGIESVSYTVTYNQNDLISFFINTEACGAYCTSWAKYYTYSVVTGEYLSIDRIVRLSDEFKNKINQDREQRYDVEITELEKLYKEHPEDLDSATCSEIVESYKGCKSDFQINDFLLYPKHLSLMEKCDLPHALNSFGLSFSLNYDYKEIKEELLQKMKNYDNMGTLIDTLDNHKIEILLGLLASLILSFVLKKAFPNKDKILLFYQILQILFSTVILLPIVHLLVLALVALIFESIESWSETFFNLGIFLPLYAFFVVLILYLYYIVKDVLLCIFFRKPEWIGYKLVIQGLPFILPLFIDPVNYKLILPTLVVF